MRPADPPELALDDQLCFALYSAANAMTASYRRGLTDVGLTYSQYVVLLVLWADDTVAMTELGRRLHLDSATLSPVLKRLEARGLVTRRRRPQDERTVEIACTEAGRLLRPRVVEVQARVERDTGLGEQELAALREDLHALAARLRGAATATSPSGRPAGR